MRKYVLKIALVLYSLSCYSQKPVIDYNAITNWPFLGNAIISNDGNYVSYSVNNQPLGGHTQVLTGINYKWKIELQRSKYSYFTSDSKHGLFLNEGDSLGIIELGTSSIRYIPMVESSALSGKGGDEWLIYQLKNPQKSLIIHSISTGKEKRIDFVQRYILAKESNILLYLTEEKRESVTQYLHWLDIASDEMTTIWRGSKAENFIFSKRSNQIAFCGEQSSFNHTEKAIWYYKGGTQNAIKLPINTSLDYDSTLRIENIIGFSTDGNSLFLNLRQKSFSQPQSSLVDIWSSSDVKLKSLQLKEFSPKTYKAVFHIEHSQLIRLEKENETLKLPTIESDSTNYWGLIVNSPGDISETSWNLNALISVFLISLRDGSRKKIEGLNDFRGNISPSGKYVIYYNPKQNSYFSYETESGINRNITKSISVNWMGYSTDRPNSHNFSRGIAGWGKKDAFVLIYDHNDIWEIDMGGKKPPLNITNGYGKKNEIVFSLSLSNYANAVFSRNQSLILNAFSLKSKENGYYSKSLDKSGNPELLSMSPYLYDIPENPYIPDEVNFIPQKALDAKVYLIRRMKCDEAANFFITTDFKTFTKLSDVHPNKTYNWLTSELITWNGLDGELYQGILYKPENFDLRKKYPIIFHYYEKKSDGLHAFLQPQILDGGGNINIPWYVSNGYLIFLPDIHYKIGETGASVINSVVAAAHYFSHMPWVNSKKMGIQGLSFGGYETNYLVTHTNLFAAACSASGLSDLISAYGNLVSGSYSKQVHFESTQFRMGANLWQRPDLYIKNSPIFFVNKVVTPLLIMHTTNDGTCAFSDAVEFFTALRRLGKKAWMLQYEGNHGVDADSALDFSIRMKQYFDHYLKDAPAPKWMIQGVPAKLKGFDDGLELVKVKDPKTGKWVTP